MTTPTDALATLGTIINEDVGRDAIHIATYPVTASEQLFPGQHIGIGPDGATTKADHIGIVDAFLTGPVFPGQRFWMMLYPRTITSLRHEWTHPAIDAASIEDARTAKEISEQWLRDFVARSDCPGYEQVVAKAINNDSWSNKYLHFDDVDAHGEIQPEFWDHIEVVTGRTIPKEDRAEYFSCSC